MKKSIIYIFQLFIIIILSKPYIFSMHALPESPGSNFNTVASLSLSLHTGLCYGAMGEYVYNGKQKISKLGWEIKPIVIIGSVLGVNIHRRFIAGIGYWIGVNDNTGDMEDTDWDNFGIKTRISHHNSRLMYAKIFDINAGYVLFMKQGHRISLHGGYKYRLTCLEASNGYVESPPGSARISVEGSFVQYEQMYKIPYAGINWSFGFHRNFYISTSCIYSFYVFCDAEDTHLRTNQTFHDSMRGGDYIFGGILIGWRTDSGYRLSISGNYSIIKKFRGDTYTVEAATGSKSITYKNSAAAGAETYGVKLSIGNSVEWIK